MLVKSKVKYIQSLSQKKVRDEEGLFVAEGPKIINELLNSGGLEAVEIFAVDGWKPQQETNITVIDHQTLSRISALATPNRVVGIFRKPSLRALHLADHLTLMADNVQDPGNLGTIVRCADWFGIKQVVCGHESADVFGPKALQSTMGSIGRVAVYYEDLEKLLRAHPSVSVYAATLDGDNLKHVKPVDHGIILIGNESKGISAELLQFARHRITIPRIGMAESLNAAVAAGIILSYLVKSLSPLRSHS